MKKPHEPHHSVSLKRKSHKTKNPLDGVIVTSDELYHMHNEAMRLIHHSESMISSLFPGAYKAMFHGRGLEFKEVREYQWGDDYRSIDWRVTARTGHMHTKLFHQEQEKTLYLLVDGSDSMHFGTKKQFKWVLAARIAALFSWLAYENGDRVGALVCGDSEKVRFQRPGMGDLALVKVFHLLAQKEKQLNFKQEQKAPGSRLYDGLNTLQQVVRKNARILILSDFLEIDTETIRQLGKMAHHYELAAINIYDPLEKSLPVSGHYSITDGWKSFNLLTSHKISKQYQEQFQQQQQALAHQFRQFGIALHTMGTHEDIQSSLRQIQGHPRHQTQNLSHG